MSSLTATLSKRECILLEAAKMFARFGFKKTSIDDIAREAGVGKGTVYLAAESKEELFYQVLYREVRSWQAKCAKVIDPRVPADELLMLLAMEAQKNLGETSLVQDLFRGEMAKMLPKWAGRFEELRKLGRANVAEVLRIGVSQKLFRSDLDIDTLSGVLQDFQLARWILRPDGMSDLDFAAAARLAFEVVLRGITIPHAKNKK
jgi:AcrR family transcriptional regulator